MVLDGPISGDGFEACVGQVLVPELGHGDVVIMDNLSSHKRVGVRALIEAAGARTRHFSYLAGALRDRRPGIQIWMPLGYRAPRNPSAS